MRAGRDDPEKPLRQDNKTLSDFAAMGVEMPEIEESDDGNVIEVWDINWSVLEVFLALETQWRAVTIGGGFDAPKLLWLGIDYAAADVIVRRHGFASDDRQVFDDLKLMEHTAIAAQDGLS